MNVRSMVRWGGAAVSAAAGWLLVAGAGCGSQGGGVGCRSNSDCATGNVCNAGSCEAGASGVDSGPACAVLQAPCKTDKDCCGNDIDPGICSQGVCARCHADGDSCTTADICCGGCNTAGACQCLPSGHLCEPDGQSDVCCPGSSCVVSAETPGFGTCTGGGSGGTTGGMDGSAPTTACGSGLVCTTTATAGSSVCTDEAHPDGWSCCPVGEQIVSDTCVP
jgi:Cys-rich repeat protein